MNKIVFVVNYFPFTPGGAELQSLQIASSIKNEYEVNYVVVSSDVRKLTKTCDNGFIIWQIPKRKLLRRILGRDQFLNYFILNKIFNHVRPDFVYQRCAGFHTWLVALLKKKYNYRLSVHLASDADVICPKVKDLKSLVQRIEYRVVKRSLKKVDQVLVQNVFQKENCHADNPLLVYNFSNPVEILTKKNDSPIVVLWIANIKPIKQPEIFLEIAAEFKNVQGVKFVMIGSPGDSVTMGKIQRAENELPNFKYLGYLNNDKINDLLGESHLLVNTSYKEGFSNTYVQAWFRGCAVLSLNSNPDNLFDNHKLGICAKGDIKQIHYFIQSYLNNKQMRQEFVHSVRNFALNNLSSNKIIPIIRCAILNENSSNYK